MKKTNLKSTFLAVFGLASLAIAVPMSIANAQKFPGQGQQKNPGQVYDEKAAYMNALGGGGVAMTQDSAYLYIVQGNNIYKINKRDLQAVAASSLPKVSSEKTGK